MTIQLDGELLETVVDTLAAATKELAQSRQREMMLAEAVENGKLLTESEAMAYLGRDANTLLYYRKNGLNYYKCGRDVWYTKGDINAWLASGKVNRRKS